MDTLSLVFCLLLLLLLDLAINNLQYILILFPFLKLYYFYYCYSSFLLMNYELVIRTSAS